VLRCLPGGAGIGKSLALSSTAKLELMFAAVEMPNPDRATAISPSAGSIVGAIITTSS
jgi:hypothetical protein